jgi:hypothetical protein
MDIGSKYHHAELRIKRLKETDEFVDLEFLFVWKSRHCVTKKEVRKSDLARITQVLTDPAGITNEAHLHDIGASIWIIFPDPIRKILTEFDNTTKKLLEYSNSRITLTIIVDRLDIPWELSLTADRKEYWYKRYLVARQLECYCCENPEQPTEKLKSLLLIMETYDEKKNNENNPETLREWDLSNERLRDLIEKINNEQKGFVHIELRRYPIVYGDLISELQGEYGAYDGIIYIGRYIKKNNNDEGIPIENPHSQQIDIIHYEDIDSSKHSHPLIFFDACKTGINNIQEFSPPVPGIVDCLLSNKASAFIGTIQKVEAVTATTFAYYFIKSLCQDGSSLSQAMLDARNYTDKEFKESEYECRRVQSSSYILIGDSLTNLHSSFLHRGKKVRLIWPEALDRYCEQFGEEIYPSNLDGVESGRCNDFYDLEREFNRVQKEMQSNTNLLPIVDMPIPRVLEVVANAQEGEEWVIISSVFQPYPEQEDAMLYYVDDLEKAERLLIDNYPTQVLAMCCAYLKARSEKLYETCARRFLNMDYKRILENMTKNIKGNALDPVAFVLVGEYKLIFDKFLSEQTDVVRKRVRAVPLRREFKTLLERDNWKQYQFKGELPASVLITRESYARDYRKLFIEVLSKWYEWVDRCFKVRHEALSQVQRPMFILEEDCIEAIINFSRFIHEEQGLNGNVLGKKLDTKRPLQKSDFIVIPPRQLSSEAVLPSECSPSCLAEKREDLERQLNTKRNQLLQTLEKEQEDYTDNIDRNQRDTYEEKERLIDASENSRQETEVALEKEISKIRAEIASAREKDECRIRENIKSLKIKW